MSSFSVLRDCIMRDMQEPGVAIPPKMEFTATAVPPIPTFEIERDRGSETVSISSLTNEIVFTRPVTQLTKFNHDFVFDNYSEVTDMAFSNSSISLPTADNKLTPDLIYEQGNYVAVVEFATLQEASQRSLNHNFDKKVFAYREAIMSRIEAYPDKVIKYFIIVVSSNMVATNLSLPVSEMNHLCFRLRCARDLKISLKNQDLDVDLDRTELLARQKSTRLAFQTVTEPVIFNKWFSEEFKESCERMTYDQAQIRSLVLDAVAESKRHHKEHFGMSDEDYSFESAIKTNYQRCLREVAESVSRLSDETIHESKKTKSIVNLPLILPEETSISSTAINGSQFANFSFHKYDTPADCFTELWKRAHDAILYQDIYRADESEDLNQEAFLDLFKELRVSGPNLSDKEKEKKKKDSKLYKRFFAKSLTPELRKVLAMDGVQKKTLTSKDLDIEVKESEAKKSLNWLVDTRPQEAFLDTHHSQLYTRIPRYMSKMVELDLIREALAVHGNNLSDHLLRFTSQALSTKAGLYYSVVSDIGQELAISLRQNCPKDCFVLKKLRRHEVYLLIKPTKSASHIFVSFAWKDHPDLNINPLCLSEDHQEVRDLILTPDNIFGENNIFREFKQIGEFKFSPFVSFKQHKLTNLLHAESMFIASIAHAFEVANLPQSIHCPSDDCGPSEDVDVSLKKMAWRLSNFIMMMHMHDKTKAEEAMTLSRYICMEGFVSFPRVPMPYKMINKLETKVTSTLQLIIMRRLFRTMESICRHPYEIEREPTSEYDLASAGVQHEPLYKNLRDPIFGDSLQTPDLLLSFFYLGYFKNKNETPESNSSYQLLTKILELEDKLPENAESLGLSSKNLVDTGYHEFNRDFLNLICNTGKSMLRSKLGQNYLEIIEGQILLSISEVDLEDLSTLKATSNFGPGLLLSKNVKSYHRSKLIEKAPGLRSKGTKLFDLMKPCLEVLESQDSSLYIDIFKKAQHGGLREIYVLSLESRVVQLVIERISRVLCSYFESETMTHPKNKHDLQKEHYRRCNEKFKTTEYLTTSSSDDAAKWSQGHFVTKFYIMLRTFTPKYMHNFIWRTLKLWTKKRIMIPEDILRLIDRNEPPKLNQPFFSDLIAGHKGLKNVPWKGKDTSYIETSSGMMQGILHYTSSLYHTLYLEWFKVYCERELRRLTPTSGRSTDSIVTVMQSSDDSSIIMSFSGGSPEQRVKGMITCSLLMEVKHTLGRALGIYKSVKCTQNTMNVMEFNSEYFFCFNLFRPTIRWIASSLVLSENESLGARQEEMSNNLTAVLEGGGAIMTTAIVQIGQALLHYRTFGSTINSCFSSFSHWLLKLNDPGLGFFLMDNPCAAGICGFKYNLLMTLKATKLSKKYKLMLSTTTPASDRLAGGEDQLPLISEPTAAGTLMQSTTIMFGNRKKWKQLIERSGLPRDWEDYVNQTRGQVLFQRAQNAEEILVKISAKAHSPGVVSSLSRGNDITRIIASGVYILQDHVVRIGSQWLNMEEEFTARVNLSGLLMSEIRRASISEDDLTDEDYHYLFPHYEEYMHLTNTLSRFNYKTMFLKRTQKRKVKSEIEVIEVSQRTIVPLEDLCRAHWYNIADIPYSKRVEMEDWAKYKRILPWLTSDPEETLKESPFESYVQLANFLSRQHLKGRSIHLSASPVVSVQGTSNISSLITNDLFPGWMLSRDVDGPVDHNRLARRVLQHCVAMISTLPGMTPSAYMEPLLLDSRPIESTSEHSRYHGLSLIHQFLIQEDRIRRSNPVTSPASEAKLNTKLREFWFDFINLNLIRGVAVAGIFTQRQRFDPDLKEYIGTAIYKGIIDGVVIELVFTFDLELRKNLLIGMSVSSKMKFINVIGAVRMLFDDLRLVNKPFSDSALESVMKDLSQETWAKYYGSSEGINLLRPTIKGHGIASYIEEPDMKFVLEPRHIKDAYFTCEHSVLKIVASFNEEFFKLNRMEPKDPALSLQLEHISNEYNQLNQKYPLYVNGQRKLYSARITSKLNKLFDRMQTLKQKILGSIRVSVISYRPRPSDVDMNIAKDISASMIENSFAGVSFQFNQKDIIRDYVLWRSCRVDLYSLARDILAKQKLESGDEYESELRNDTLKFLRERLRDGFRRLGVNLTRMQANTTEVNRPGFELSDDELNEFLFGDSSDYITGGCGLLDFQDSFVEKEFLSDQLEDAESEDFTVPYEEMAETAELISSQVFRPVDLDNLPKRFSIASHPLADRAVDSRVSSIGYSKIINTLASRTCSAEDYPVFTTLLEVLDVDDKELTIRSPTATKAKLNLDDLEEEDAF